MRKEVSMPCLTLDPISPPRGAINGRPLLVVAASDNSLDGVLVDEVRQPPRSAPQLTVERASSAGSVEGAWLSPGDHVRYRRRRTQHPGSGEVFARPPLGAGSSSRLLAGLRSPPMPGADSPRSRPAPLLDDVFDTADATSDVPLPPLSPVATPPRHTPPGAPRQVGRRRPATLDVGLCGSSPECEEEQDFGLGQLDDEEEEDQCVEAPRPRTHGGAVRRPRSLSISAFSSPPSSPALAFQPDTPGLPDRTEFRAVSTGVAVVFFDFDGTLTASPGDRAVRRMKQAELRERAPMLAPRLQALREAGLTLGIISKSTEGTIRASLECAGLTDFFDGPLVARAVGFEGKVGFIEELAKKGNLRRLGGRGEKPGRRVLLVDDDVLECERAQARGLQTYAAPADGGLQESDFDAIFQGLRLKPRARVRAASSGALGSTHSTATGHGRPPTATGVLPPLDSGRPASQSPPKPASKRRNMIMFMGGCFDG